MDINDVIIIKFIVMYYCPSAGSVHRYGRLLHMCQKFKPRLLLSNRCHVEYFDLAIVLSPDPAPNREKGLVYIECFLGLVSEF